MRNPGYWVAWVHHEEEAEDGVPNMEELCIARLSTEGVLVAAPVCTAPGDYLRYYSPMIAFGDGGLGIVVGAHDIQVHPGHLLFLRTDSAGVPVGDPLDVEVFSEFTGYSFGPAAIAWTETAFVVLYSSSFADAQLRLRRFEEMP